MFKKALFFIFLSLFILVLYYPLYASFFQQDEFMAFGNTYSFGNGWFWGYVIDSFIPNPGHYTPFFITYFAILFKWFGIVYEKWLTISLVWHVVNSFLVYVLAKKIFNNELTAKLGALVFAVYAAGQQGTSWVVADGNTHGATFFVLISLISLFKFFESKQNGARYAFISLASMVASLLFKEIAIGMFLFIPLLLIFNNYINRKKLVDKYVLIFLVVGILYFVFRYLTVVTVANSSAPVVTGSQSIGEIVINILFFPIKVVSQTVIPSYPLLKISKYIAHFFPTDISGLPGTTANEIFYLKYILGSIDWIVFGIVFLFVLKIFLGKKDRLSMVAVFSLIFIVVNSVVYALSPGRSSFIPIIDSRNLYMPSIGIVFLILSFSTLMTKSRWGVLLIVLPIVLFNLLVTRIEINKVSESGNIRKNILEQISGDYPKLNDKQIFYFESNTSYFGLPENVRILPFQSGLGQTLLVWYHRNENFDTAFFKNEYLWEIDSQGYLESGERGFGYFRDFEKLAESIKNNDLSAENAIAYRWDSRTSSLVEITAEIRKKINNEIRK